MNLGGWLLLEPGPSAPLSPGCSAGILRWIQLDSEEIPVQQFFADLMSASLHDFVGNVVSVHISTCYFPWNHGQPHATAAVPRHWSMRVGLDGDLEKTSGARAWNSATSWLFN